MEISNLKIVHRTNEMRSRWELNSRYIRKITKIIPIREDQWIKTPRLQHTAKMYYKINLSVSSQSCLIWIFSLDKMTTCIREYQLIQEGRNYGNS